MMIQIPGTNFYFLTDRNTFSDHGCVLNDLHSRVSPIRHEAIKDFLNQGLVEKVLRDDYRTYAYALSHKGRDALSQCIIKARFLGLGWAYHPHYQRMIDDAHQDTGN